MEIEKKIKIYEEVSALKKHFQKEVLELITSNINRIVTYSKESDGDVQQSKDYIRGEEAGFNEAKIWIEDIIKKINMKMK